MLNRQMTFIGLANHLVNCKLLEPTIALRAQQEAYAEQTSLVHYLVKNKILSGDEIAAVFQKIFDLDTFDLSQLEPDWLEKSLLDAAFIRQYRVIPLKKINNQIQIATSDPTDQQAMEAVTFHTGLHTIPILVNENQLNQIIELYCHNTNNKNLQSNLLKQIHLDNTHLLIHENIIQYDEPLIQFVNNIILHAIQKNASDIHIEPFETVCRIRFRLHGVLQQIEEIPNALAARIITRIKVIAKLDIAERRLPQDGRFQFQTIDVRVNTCPTLFGEKIVLRLLNSANISLAIEYLNFTEPQQKLFIKSISKPQGMILVTGPTGSGKTTTLYAALQFLNQIEKNISTVEDPIEIRLNGINQVNVNNKIGLNFSTVLRTFLRQDPDIIMVGEIRDPETAEIAIQAAQTGHLVLSTLHTNSAIETITRLQAMEIAPYNLANTLSLIIAQRLVRKLCPHCKFYDAVLSSYQAKGCQHCSNGFAERTAIYEFLPITTTLSKLIHAQAETHALLTQAKREAFISLAEASMQLIGAGITSSIEIHRVLQL